jgi:hypothetical protein
MALSSEDYWRKWLWPVSRYCPRISTFFLMGSFMGYPHEKHPLGRTKRRLRITLWWILGEIDYVDERCMELLDHLICLWA